MSDKLLSFDDYSVWLVNDLTEKLTADKRINQNEKTIVDLANRKQMNDVTKIEERVLNRLLKNEYTIYKTQFDLKKKLDKANQDSIALVRKLNKKPSASEARKARTRELIQLGGLFSIADLGFDDKGALLGALYFVKANLKDGRANFNDLKNYGDSILEKRENQKKAKSQKIEDSSESNNQ